ncbi:MAG: lipopolysaccharide biosynthesis protein [Desulfuromonadales bacterium]|nr:MAG: lipopolysaccharide biosynthesis protein [Desulfuromonadales bacterium]
METAFNNNDAFAHSKNSSLPPGGGGLGWGGSCQHISQLQLHPPPDPLPSREGEKTFCECINSKPERRLRVWSVAEQGFLSLANFGLAIFLARELPKAAWGAFSLGYALMLFSQGFQRALVSIPIATMAHSDDVLSRSLRFWRRTQTKLTLVATGALVLVALAWRWIDGDASITEALIIAALLVPGHFFLEFWRRVVIQTRNMKAAAVISLLFLLSVVLLVSGLHFMEGGALAAAAGLSACALMAGAMTRARALSRIAPTNDNLDLGQEVYRFGRWAMLSHLAFSGYTTAIQVVLSLVSGPAAMGSFAAVRNLTQPVNTLIGAIDNMDKPRAARAFAAGGFPELFSSLWRTMATLSILGGGYLLLCSVGGGYLVDYLYHARYGHAWNEVWMWCLIAAAMMAAQPLESGLYVSQRTDALFMNRLVSAAVGLGTAVITIPGWGVSGALLGLACGWLVSAALAAGQLFLFSRQAAEPEVIEG